jgi:hypothetical protein
MKKLLCRKLFISLRSSKPYLFQFFGDRKGQIWNDQSLEFFCIFSNRFKFLKWFKPRRRLLWLRAHGSATPCPLLDGAPPARDRRPGAGVGHRASLPPPPPPPSFSLLHADARTGPPSFRHIVKRCHPMPPPLFFSPLILPHKHATSTLPFAPPPYLLSTTVAGATRTRSRCCPIRPPR